MRSPAVSSMSNSAAAGDRNDLLGQFDQLVGRVAHCRDDNHDVVALPPGGDDSLSDPLDALGIGNG